VILAKSVQDAKARYAKKYHKLIGLIFKLKSEPSDHAEVKYSKKKAKEFKWEQDKPVPPPLRRIDEQSGIENYEMKEVVDKKGVTHLIKPVPPIGRIIREGDEGSKNMCSYCGSSFYRKWFGLRTSHCIQPQCVNYVG